MNDTIKWGIVGLGNVAYQFAKSFYNIKNAKLTAIASKTQNNLVKFKDEFNIETKNCYSEYEKLLENNEIDIIYLALPNNLHNEWIYKSLDACKHILVEKPAFTNFNDATRVFSHPNINKLFLGEGFMYRYHPQIIKVIELIQSNQIGKIKSIESVFGKNLITKKKFFGLLQKKKIDLKKRTFNKSLGGGTILDHGSYTVSMSLLIASLVDGINIENFELSSDKQINILDGVDVESSVELIFDNKLRCSLKASFINDIGCHTIIYGENGKILIKNSWNSDAGQVYLYNKKESSYDLENRKNIYTLEIEGISEDILNRKIEASYPGTSKNEILVSSKILDRWLNE